MAEKRDADVESTKTGQPKQDAKPKDATVGARLHRSGYSEEHVDGKDYLNTPWVKPDVLKARDKYRNLLFDQGEAPIRSTTIEQISVLGVGVSLHLRLIKYYFFFFVLATLIAVPIFVLCFAGSRLNSDEMDPLRMAKISVANVGDRNSLANYTVAPWPGIDLTYNARQISAIIMACDFAIVWMFLLFLMFLHGRIKAVTAEVDANVITASDYAVYVQGLPSDATEEEVRGHFNSLYNLREPDWTYPSSCRRCFFGRKMYQRRQFKPPSKTSDDKRKGRSQYRQLRDEDVYPVLDARNSGNAAYLKSWVAEVSIANANGTLIKRFQDQTGLWLRIRTARARAKKYYTTSAFADATRFRKAEEQLRKLEERFEQVKKQAIKLDNLDCVGAFVLFQNEESVRRCLEDYHDSESVFSLGSYWLQPPMLRFRGKHRLSVAKAPDPSQIVWQNLELTPCNRFLRQTAVNLLLAALLVVSFIFIILAQSQQTKFQNNIPNLQLCNTVLPAIAYGQPFSLSGTLVSGASLPSRLQLYHDKTDPLCSSRNLPRIYWTTPTGEASLSQRNHPNPCLDECIDRNSRCIWSAADGNLSFPLTTTVACYCTKKLTEEIANKGLFTGASSLAKNEVELCGQVAADYVTYNAFVLVASGIVVIINMFLREILRAITMLEGHPSVAALQKAIALKVFLSLFLNTALLVLLINAALPSAVKDVAIGSNQLFGGKYSGFDVRWQVAVGGGIVLTMLINTVTPHVYNMWYLWCHLPCRRLRLNKSAVTQMDLEKSYTPPEFEMPTRNAVLMNSLFSCFMYASGHPILYAVAAFSFLVSYIVDKTALLRMYRRPPMYDGAMAIFAVRALPYAAIVHLFISIWMYSENAVLYSPPVFGTQSAEVSSITGKEVTTSVSNFLASASAGDSSGLNFISRLTRENTLPLFILLAVFVFGWLLYVTAGKALVALFRQCCFCLSRGRCCKEKTGLRDLQWNPPWTGPYSLPLDPRKKHVLTKNEERAGWRIVKDNRGHVVKIRQWPRDGVTFGLLHRKGQRMLTWQVVAHQGIASYDISANPFYAFAGKAVAEARARIASEKGGKSLPSAASFHPMGAAAAATGRLGAKPSVSRISAASAPKAPDAGALPDDTAAHIDGQADMGMVPEWSGGMYGYVDPYTGMPVGDMYGQYPDMAGGYGYYGYGYADPSMMGYMPGMEAYQGTMGMDAGSLAMMGFDTNMMYQGQMYGYPFEAYAGAENQGYDYSAQFPPGSQDLALVNPNEYGDVDESGSDGDEVATPMDDDVPPPAAAADSRAGSRSSSRGSRRGRTSAVVLPDPGVPKSDIEAPPAPAKGTSEAAGALRQASPPSMSIAAPPAMSSSRASEDATPTLQVVHVMSRRGEEGAESPVRGNRGAANQHITPEDLI